MLPAGVWRAGKSCLLRMRIMPRSRPCARIPEGGPHRQEPHATDAPQARPYTGISRWFTVPAPFHLHHSELISVAPVDECRVAMPRSIRSPGMTLLSAGRAVSLRRTPRRGAFRASIAGMAPSKSLPSFVCLARARGCDPGVALVARSTHSVRYGSRSPGSSWHFRDSAHHLIDCYSVVNFSPGRRLAPQGRRFCAPLGAGFGSGDGWA